MENWGTTTEAAKLFGVNIDTIRRWAREGKIKARRSGVVWLIELESFKEWVEAWRKVRRVRRK